MPPPFRYLHIPYELLDEYLPKLSANAVKIYLVFLQFNQGKMENAVYPKQAHLKEKTGINGNSTIHKALKELVALGLIPERGK